MAESEALELASWESTLTAFVSSDRPFQVVHRLPVANPATADPHAGAEQCPAADSSAGRQGPAGGSVRSISVLDSSFNPPTAAHAALARASLRRARPGGPATLLLLLATANADKPLGPASLAHRLAMISRFALQLRRGLLGDPRAPTSIDIGLTTAARYADKRVAIAACMADPEQAYVVGYDTFERVVAPRYYAGHDPPLSALAGFFGSGARLQVVLRPMAEGEGGEESVRQRRAVQSLASGALSEHGFLAEWAAQVEILELEGEYGGSAASGADLASFSSTRARRAARDGKAEELARLVCPAVADWIREHGLYQDEP